MDVDLSPRGVATTGAYLLAGAAGTAVLSVVLLRAAQPLRPAVYRAFYLAVGPWSATVAASVLTFVAGGLLAFGGVVVAATTLRDGFDAALAGGVAGLAAGLVGVVAAAAYAGVPGLLVAAVAAAVFVAGVALWLWRRGAGSRSYAAFAGGVPVLALLVLALGFGLGWGGGYDVVAEEVPASSVEGADASFADAPELRDALLSPSGDYAYCETENGRRVCRLPLRGYDDEAGAARFLARHGVRCPYLDAPAAGGGSLVVADGDTYYRVRCRGYGD